MSDYRIIHLHDGTEVKVDPEDYDYLSQFPWSKSSGGYARTGAQSRLMHRIIMDAPKGKVVDHINGDIYDNRKSNLRVCTQRENARNHRLRFVTFDRRYGTWRAAIKVDYETHHLGTYATEPEAVHAYYCAALYYFGEYANEAAKGATPKSAAQLKREAGRRRLGYRGVRASISKRNPYTARIRVNGQERHLGQFPTAEAAARAFDRAALEHGFPAWRLNFPPKESLR